MPKEMGTRATSDSPVLWGHDLRNELFNDFIVIRTSKREIAQS